MTRLRNDPAGASWLSLLLAAAVVTLLVLAAGCGASIAETETARHAEMVQCATNEAAILQKCGDEHTPSAACAEQVATERDRCAAAVRQICRHGRGCP